MPTSRPVSVVPAREAGAGGYLPSLIMLIDTTNDLVPEVSTSVFEEALSAPSQSCVTLCAWEKDIMGDGRLSS